MFQTTPLFLKNTKVVQNSERVQINKNFKKVRLKDMFKFFYAKEAEQYLFYRIPQMLFTEEKFRLMSCEAKVLYGLLLDRVGLSRRNGWADDEGRLYIYFTQDEACEKLNVRKNKIIKIYLELEQVGLI